ncbi:MAG: AAA family ATPase, partial [Bacteroidales bacterium]|nr:AAA family ATPase [Bacteroidales bacterium]
MKIRKISIKNYKIFDNLDLDFTDNKGKTLDTIILAGVNGCGKTTLLQLISKIFSESSNRFRLSTSIPVKEFTSDTDSIFCDKIAIEIELPSSTRKAFQELLSNFMRVSKEIKNNDKVVSKMSTTLRKFLTTSKPLTLEYELKTDDDKVTIVKNDFLLFAILSSEKLSKLARIAYFISYSSDFYKKNSKMNINNALSELINNRESEIIEDGIVSYV